MPPHPSAHDMLELHTDVAKMLVEMRHVREDVKDLKDTLKEELPELRKRIAALELQADRWKTRLATAAAIGTGLGSALLWILQQILER